MLESLHIKNLALVSELDIDFSSGLNVITGETGAGKSLIIGAVQLLAGGRATPGLIRRGAASCDVTGIIALANCQPTIQNAISSILDDAGIPPCEEGRLLLRRVITESGSRAFVNATPVTAGFLKTLGGLLIDIHGPHDNQTLLLPACQRQLLDAYMNRPELLEACRAAFAELTDIRQQLADLEHAGMNPEEVDLLKHQLREIKDAGLQPGEDTELYKRYKLLENGRRLLELSEGASQGLWQSEQSIVDQLGDILRQVREIGELDEDGGKGFEETLSAIIEELQGLGEDLADYSQRVELDPEEYQRIETRMELIQKLKRKYGPALEDVLATQTRLRERITAILGRGEAVEALRKRLGEAEKAFADASQALHAARLEVSAPLATAIEAKLRNLGFAKAQFSIKIAETTPTANGIDAVDYYFTPNIGEDLQLLKDTASSGETARVMLAIKTVLSEADAVPILVFDEIDANVGGRVAGTVADELLAVGSHHQVFSITHMPQIAAAASCHYLVEKHTEDDRTVTRMERLEGKAREQEIIRMLGADEDSAAAISHVRDLLAKHK